MPAQQPRFSTRQAAVRRGADIVIPHASSGVPGWLAARSARGRMLLALDFDGTLSPIASTPAEATLPERSRAVLHALAARADTRLAVVSGRGLDDLMSKVGLPDLYYAGNHGLEIRGPGLELVHPDAVTTIPSIQECLHRVRASLADVAGVLVEDKRLSLSVHYRLVGDPAQETAVHENVRAACADIPGLRVMEGKKIVEVRPDIDWHKGRAIEFLIENLLDGDSPVLFLGDDVTDEDGFHVMTDRGAGIIVADPQPAHTAARYFLSSPEDVYAFLHRLAKDSAA